MIFLAFLEIVFIILAVTFIATQMVWPAYKGTPFFPMFRREHGLERDISEAREEVEIAEMEKELAKQRQKAEAVRGKNIAE